MLVRLVLILVLVLVVLAWLRVRKKSKLPAQDKEGTPAPAELSAQPVLPCAFCGAYLPRGDALPGRAGALYCSEAHRREAGDD